MAMIQDRSPSTSFEQEYTKSLLKNNATNYGRRLFEIPQGDVKKDQFQMVGDRLVVSQDLFFQLKYEFPWEEIRSFTTEEVINAAKKAGYTIYNTEHPSPYINIYPDDNQIAIVCFENAPETRSENYSPVQRLLRHFFLNKKKVLETRFSILYIPDNRTITPDLSINLVPPNTMKISVTGLEDVKLKRMGSYQQIINMIVKQLEYRIADVELSKSIEYIKEDEILSTQDVFHYRALKNQLINEVDRVYYLSSELDVNKKSE